MKKTPDNTDIHDIIDMVADLNSQDEDKYNLAYDHEYLTLYISCKAITSGEYEVRSRIKQLKQELGVF